MAQHIPINQLTSKVFLKIEKAIRKDFQNPYIKGSLKYEWLGHLLRPDQYKDYQESPTDEVYLTNRYIGKGIVYGDTHGSFEIHFDRSKREFINIYLVA